MGDGLLLDTIVCVVKRRLTKSAQARLARLAEAKAVLKSCWPMKNWRYRRMEKWWAVSALPLHYSTGLRRKKKVIQAKSEIACFWLVPPW